MSNKVILGKSRTVRLSRRTDEVIEAHAAKTGRTASEVIREALEAEFAAAPGDSAGQWVRKVGKTKPERPPSQAFSAA